jgi:hypothetical protein
MRWFAWIVFLASAWMALPAWADCPLDLGRGTGWVVFSEHYMIAFRSDPLHVEVGQPVALVLNVCTKDGEAAELVKVDAQILDDEKQPSQHLRIVAGTDGHYRAEGLSITAPGHWEIAFDVRSADASEQLSHEIIVK